jgi:LuxR family maltose regulon positive regulatory protein
MVNWLNTLPAEHIRSQPEICRAYAVMMTMEGYIDAAENWFRLAEDSLGSMQITDPLLAMRFRIIPLYRSVNARFHGDYRRAINLCQGVLDQTSVTEVRPMGVALLFLGQAHFYAGNTQLADQVLTDSIQFNLASGHLSAYLNASHHLAKLRVLQGRLQEARVICEQATRLAEEQATPVYAGTEHAGLGDLEREWNQLDSAAARIQKGITLAEAGDHIFFLMDVYLAGLRLSMAQSDWEAARRYLDRAEQLARRCPTSSENGQIRAWQARLHLAQGEIAEASNWADTIEKMESEVSSDPQSEFILLTLARIWLAQGKTSQAAALLERVRTGAEEAGRGGRLLEAQMLQALADQAAGREKQAVEKITRVLARAEPEGYVRLFVDEGAPLAKLLYKAAGQLSAPLGNYAERLLAVFFQEAGERQAVQTRTAQDAGLIKPLSEREQEVLRLVAAGKTNQEIAAELYIAIGTVKRHAINIFTKLDVKNRTEAVAKARELGLLESR